MKTDAEVLHQAILSITASLDLEEVIRNCLEAFEGAIPLKATRIFLVSSEESRLMLVAWRESGSLKDTGGVEVPHGSPLLNDFRHRPEPILISRPAADSRLEGWPVSEGAGQWLGLPLMVHDDLIGLLVLEGDAAEAYTGLQISAARAFAGQTAIAIQNAQLFQQIRLGRERQRLLSRRLVEVQEAERRSIARELHDQIGQVLTGLKLVLEMTARETGDLRNENLAEALSLVDELMAQVRELSLSLRPAMLDDLGLLPALIWQFERYTAQTQVAVDFKHRGVEGIRFDSEIETAAYRIVQEALTNVARHAGVDRANVRLWADEGGLYLQVEDLGRGFDPAAAMSSSVSSGLSGMRERANLLGGQLTIESEPDERTLLSASLPLDGHLERRRRMR